MKVTQNPIAGNTGLENTKAAEKTSRIAPNQAPSAKATPGPVADTSTVQISDQALLMKQARELVHATPDVRTDKISDLQRRIKDGSYRVDSAAIADKLIDEHLASSFGKNNL